MRYSCPKQAYEQQTSMQGGDPEAPKGGAMSTTALQHKHFKAEEEKLQDRKGSCTLCWSFTSNMAKTPFIPMWLQYNTMTMELISQHCQKEVY